MNTLRFDTVWALQVEMDPSTDEVSVNEQKAGVPGLLRIKGPHKRVIGFGSSAEVPLEAVSPVLLAKLVKCLREAKSVIAIEAVMDVCGIPERVDLTTSHLLPALQRMFGLSAEQAMGAVQEAGFPVNVMSTTVRRFYAQ